MTAKIKLNAASGGGSFSLQAPSSSANNRVFTLPDSADATILTSTATLGKVLQTVRAQTQTRLAVGSNTGTFYTSALTADITPSATSSKVFVLASGNYYTTNTTTAGLSLFRGSTNLGHSTHGLAYVGGHASSYGAWTIHYLDSPNTTSATTYSFRLSRVFGSDAVYAPVGDDNYSPAQIFLAEVA